MSNGSEMMIKILPGKSRGRRAGIFSAYRSMMRLLEISQQNCCIKGICRDQCDQDRSSSPTLFVVNGAITKTKGNSEG